MKIVVIGLWHQGCVVAACVARHFDVIGLDSDSANVAALSQGHAPIVEPDLDPLLRAGIDSGKLAFTADRAAACRGADLLWVTFDTPVNDDDEADVESVLAEIRRCVPLLPVGALVLLSSQLPVGTTRLLEAEFGPLGYWFSCSPENLRLGKAIQIFEHADRVIVGCRGERSRELLGTVFGHFTEHIIWMSPESAEMTKHAINSFLAVSITFMNEVARLCELSGADAKEVERGLKSESRIGPKAYLSPGSAFAGGTLARDVVALTKLGQQAGESLEVVPAIKRSNDRHQRWALEKIQRIFPVQAGKRIALLGLTYKAGTNTLRRSSAIELAQELVGAGFAVHAYDPSQSSLPPGLSSIKLERSAAEAVRNSDAVVVCTEWPEFRTLDWPQLAGSMRGPVMVDATRFLISQVAEIRALQYLTVGAPA